MNLNGILLVNKEKNMTSRDVVNIVSKKLNTKKVGHTGTLDPMAQGVLVLTIGRATKLGGILSSEEKEYVAEVKKGILTDTLDTTGNILKEKSYSKNLDIEKLLKSFKKTYMQEVPMYSAVKVNGKKLYEYARKGIKVKLPKKEVTIKEIKLLEKKDNSFRFKCLVSKGTYIRSLIRDMGYEVDEYFCMSDLIRTKQGNFKIEDTYSINDIKNNNYKLLTIEQALSDIPVIIVDDDLEKKIKNGVKIENVYNIEDKVIFKNRKNKIIAIYVKEKNILKNYVMIDID